MPKRELKFPKQIEDWLCKWGHELKKEGSLVLIGSGGILWHAWQQGRNEPLPGNSMDADPITEDEEVAEKCYDSVIGSEFEEQEGWHINIMPKQTLKELPAGWEERVKTKTYGKLKVMVPSIPDLLAPKLKRGEPRDKKHAEYAQAFLLQ